MPNEMLPNVPEILTLRLKSRKVARAFQQDVEFSCGEIPGEMLSWLSGDWFFLTEGTEALLAGRLAISGKTVIDICLGAGALETARIPFSELAYRKNLSGESKADLRDSGFTGVAMPTLTGDTVATDGRVIALDWQLTIAGIHRAWQLFPAPTGPTGDMPWADIPVGHIDTGCTRHPALGFVAGKSRHVKADLGLNLFKDMQPPDYDAIPGTIPPEEDGPFDNLTGAFGGHGTRTLSTLTGFYDVESDSIPPFYGAAPGATVIPYRVTNSIIIDHVQRQIAQAIDDATSKGCRVISMSLGGIIPWSGLANAIDRAYEAGVIVCAAAGNVISEVTYPGRYNRTITLGGASPDGAANFTAWKDSSRGQFVDVCGPADGIRRASIELRKGKQVPFISGGGNGTSFATAMCAGIAVLWLAKRKAELNATYGAPSWKWPAAFKQLIKTTAITPADLDPAKPAWDTANYGAGLYQAGKLLAAALPAAASLHREAKAGAPFDPNA